MRRRPKDPEALKALYEAQKILRETRKELLDKRYKTRKAFYEQQKEARLKLGDVAEFGVASVRRPIGGGERKLSRKRWVERPPVEHPRTVKPGADERPPLIDVVDEGDHLRVDVQFRDIPWPEDIVGELDEVSFKHGVLELKLKKRKKKLSAEEARKLESGEGEEITAKVKEKLMLKMKKQKEKPVKSMKKKSEKPNAQEKEDLNLKEL